MTRTQLLVIVPTYNERKNLLPLVNSVQDALSTADILIVDDNSPDGTGDIATERASRDAKVHVLHRSKKNGLGRAYIAGFRWALQHHYSHIFQMDADFSHDPATLPDLLEATSNHDVALGSRWILGGGTQGWPYHRKILSQTANLYARTVLRTNIRDLTGGYKCLRRRVLETIDLNNITSIGYGFQIELTWLAKQYGFTVVEVPIIFSERTTGKSKLAGSTLLEAAYLVWQLRNNRIITARPSGPLPDSHSDHT